MTETKSRLAGMIAPKGNAPRPADVPQRGEQAAEPARDLPATKPGMGVKRLTLRLADDEYERLRAFAFKHRTTHQEVLSLALREYLKGRE